MNSSPDETSRRRIDQTKSTRSPLLDEFLQRISPPADARDMRPRQVLPGSTYLLTRRCAGRRFLLRPCPTTNRIITYCLAYASRKTGVEVHAYCAMSNHVHAVVTDKQGRLPEFLHLFHRHVAVAMNRFLDRMENFWRTGQASAVRLLHPDDVLEKIAYVLSNPTLAGLVEAPSLWPGALSNANFTTFEAHLPKQYFRQHGGMPPRLQLPVSIPACLRYLGKKTVEANLADRVSHLVGAMQARMKRADRKFLGVKAVLRMPRNEAANSSEGERPGAPIFAGSGEVRKQAYAHWRNFQLAYRAALTNWRLGHVHTLFPDGTWLMRRHHPARCRNYEPPESPQQQ